MLKEILERAPRLKIAVNSIEDFVKIDQERKVKMVKDINLIEFNSDH